MKKQAPHLKSTSSMFCALCVVLDIDVVLNVAGAT
jgi:hypothetical protein